MKKSILNQVATVGQRQPGAIGAFTLTELLVVMGVMAMLSAVLLSASFTTQENVLRAECVSNLRQIGVGLNLYSTEANGYLPQTFWPSGANPWEIDMVCRNTPGTHIITVGPMGLGILWGAKTLPDPRVLYCPSLAKVAVTGSYEYYSYPNGTGTWPTTPPLQPGGAPEDKVRIGYMYYTQQKAQEVMRGYTLPVLSYQCDRVTFVSPNPSDPTPQTSMNVPCAIKLTDTDPSKAMTIDLLMQLSGLAHKNNGQPAGANALFSDGHVKFQPVNGNSGINQAFNAGIWNFCPGSTLGNDPPPSIQFRRVFSYFHP